MYQEKRDWAQQEFIPQVDEALRHGEVLPQFLLYLQAGEVMSGLFMADPSLPEELLPADWSGKAVLDELTAQYRRLAEAIPRDSFYAQFT
ncbi:hypothetical protein D3C73_1402040 [compost metagenome]